MNDESMANRYRQLEGHVTGLVEMFKRMEPALERVEPVLGEVMKEVGLHPWVTDADGKLWRELSRIAMLEHNVSELFERCQKAENKVAALEATFEAGFTPDLSRCAKKDQ